MSNSVRPQQQPTRFPHPWDSPGKNTGVGCHFLLQCMKVESESEVAQSCWTLSKPMDCSLPGSFSMGFSRQEYRSGVPSPSLATILEDSQFGHWNMDNGVTGKWGARGRSLAALNFSFPKLQGDRLYSQRRQWHPTPVLLPGESHGWRSLVGCSPWGH